MAAEDLVALNKEKYDDLHYQIMEYYRDNLGAKQTEVAKALGVCRSTIKRHLELERKINNG